MVEGYSIVNQVSKLIKEENQKEPQIHHTIQTPIRTEDHIDSFLRQHQGKGSIGYDRIVSTSKTSEERPKAGMIKSTFGKKQKPEKLKGSKIYMSSQLVEAVIQMRKTTDFVSKQRMEKKEKLQMLQ